MQNVCNTNSRTLRQSEIFIFLGIQLLLGILLLGRSVMFKELIVEV